ncbi:MAG TPA: GDP-mannose 4,6-dehydratase [Acidimicrobiales bacterium]|nr:GDP-mannose 4,6-dehydratase [Acidimicrobiales bacterium]
MRALVTGAGGFVGRHLVEHCRAQGDDVTAVDVDCDVTDADRVREVVRAASPEVIYHLAALSSVADSWSDPAAYTRVNVLGTHHVLAAAHEVASCAVVLVSSADVYGVVDERDLPLVETHAPSPASPYAQSKLEAEGFARRAARDGLRVLIARPFPHLGPGQSTRFAVPALTARLLEARDRRLPAIAVGELRARRDYTDVRDVVRAYRLLSEFGRSGETYHVSSGHDIELGALAALLAARLDLDVAFEVDPTLLRPVEVPVLRGNFAKLHEVSGWEPEITLSQSLDDVIRDVEARRQSGTLA